MRQPGEMKNISAGAMTGFIFLSNQTLAAFADFVIPGFPRETARFLFAGSRRPCFRK